MHLPRRWRKAVVVLVLVQLLMLVGVLALRHDRVGDGGSNGGLRGSKPPAGAQMPDLSAVDGVEPRMPSATKQGGRVQVLVATCIEGAASTACRSGDVFGGFLGRIDMSDVPDEVDLHAVVWSNDGNGIDRADIDRWRSEWNVADRIEVHAAGAGGDGDNLGGRSSHLVQRELGVGESGVLLVGDRRGRWRSTFHAGQLDRDDLIHDLEELAG